MNNQAQNTKTTTKRPQPKTLTGKVVSDKTNKTITVHIQTKRKHPKYGKFVKKTTKLTAHDEKNTCKTGNTVQVIQTKPISKTKRWRVVGIINK